jgi:photosystem II stability/assembly factor-like uncharacterized protein
MENLKSYYALLTGISILLSFFEVAAQPYQLKNCQNFGLRAPNMRYEDTYFISRDTGFICDLYGNIYKTTDACNNWELKINVPVVEFRSIEFSDDGQIGIAGTLSGHLYRSEDRGESWKNISSSLPDTGVDAKRICGLAHSGNNNFYGVGWWGSERARLYRSTDAGKTWTVKYMDTSMISLFVDILCKEPNMLFATGGRLNKGIRNSVVLKSIDAGDTWTEVFSDNSIGGKIWKIQFITPDVAYGAIQPYYYPDSIAIIKSTDGGNSWNIIPIGSITGNHANISTQAVGFIDEQRGWVGGYFVGFFETYDAGKTWNYVKDYSIVDMNRIFRVDATTIYATHRGGIASYMPLWPTEIANRNISQSLVPTNSIQVVFEISHLSNVVMELINISNQKTQRIMSASMPPGKYTQTIDISGYPEGSYMIWLGNDEIPLVQKFIIQR